MYSDSTYQYNQIEFCVFIRTVMNNFKLTPEHFSVIMFLWFQCILKIRTFITRELSQAFHSWSLKRCYCIKGTVHIIPNEEKCKDHCVFLTNFVKDDLTGYKWCTSLIMRRVHQSIQIKQSREAFQNLFFYIESYAHSPAFFTQFRGNEIN